MFYFFSLALLQNISEDKSVTSSIPYWKKLQIKTQFKLDIEIIYFSFIYRKQAKQAKQATHTGYLIPGCRAVSIFSVKLKVRDRNTESPYPGKTVGWKKSQWQGIQSINLTHSLSGISCLHPAVPSVTPGLHKVVHGGNTSVLTKLLCLSAEETSSRETLCYYFWVHKPVLLNLAEVFPNSSIVAM